MAADPKAVATDGGQAAPEGHLVVTVHGIRTYGGWQARLEDLVHASGHAAEFRHYRFGYFSAFAFLLPFARWWVTRRFRRELLSLVRERSWARIDIVAHSFGTHLTGWAVHHLTSKDLLDGARFHTLLLSGSVLKPSFPWRELIHPTSGTVGRVVNDCGTADGILLLNQLVVLGTGMAGRIGFVGSEYDAFRNRFFPLGHSGYFQAQGDDGHEDDFIRRWWLPLLTEDSPPPEHDERPALSAARGAATWMLSNAEPFKVALWLLPFLLLTLYFWILRNEAEERAREAQSIGLAGLSSRMLEREPGLSLLLALEAHDTLDEGDHYPAATRRALFEGLSRVGGLPLRAHDAAVSKAAFSPDGRWLITTGHDLRVIAWRIEDDRATYVCDLPGHTQLVKALAFDPTGAWLVTGGRDGRVLLRAVTPDGVSEDAQELRGFTPQGDETKFGGAEHVAIIEEGAGSRLVVAGRMDQIRMWPLTAEGVGAPEDIVVPDGRITGFACRRREEDGGTSPGFWIAAGGKLTEKKHAFSYAGGIAGFLRVWFVRVGQGAGEGWPVTSPTLREFREPIAAISIAPLGRVAAAGGSGVWQFDLDVETGPSAPRDHLATFSVAVPAIQHHPTRPNSFAAIVQEIGGSKVYFWYDVALPAVQLSGHTDKVTGLSFSNGGAWIATVSRDRTARLWPTETFGTGSIVLRGHEDFVRLAAFSPDGRSIVTTSTDQTARFWKFDPTGLRSRVQFQYSDDDDLCGALAVSPQGRAVAAGMRYGGVALFELTAEGPVRAEGLPENNSAAVDRIAFGPRGKDVYLGCRDGALHVFTRGAQPERRLLVEASTEQGFRALAVHPDGTQVAFVRGDGRLVVVALAGGSTPPGLRTVIEPAAGEVIQTVAYHPGARFLAVGSKVGYDGSIRLIPLPGFEDPPPRAVKLARINDVAFGPQGRTLVAACSDRRVRMWAVNDGGLVEPPAVARGHRGHVTGARVSADGNWLVSGGDDRTVCVWRLENGGPAGDPVVFDGQPLEVWNTLIEPGGQWLVIGGDGWIRFRRVDLMQDPEDARTRIRSVVDRNLTRDEWRRFLPGRSFRKIFPGLGGADSPGR